MAQDAEAHPLRDRPTQLIAIAVALCAAAVMLAWHLRWDALLQVLPGMAPMQYNAALAMLLAALGIAALASRRPRRALPPALLSALIGLASLLQYALGVDFGIDQLLHTAYLTAHTSHPGRMSPLSGIAFLLLGVVIPLLVGGTRGRRLILASLMLSLVLAIAGSSLVGYLIAGVPLVDVPGATLMALNTAGLLLLVALALRRVLRPRLGRVVGLPPPVSIELVVVALLVGSLLLWRELGADARQSQQALQRAELEWLAARLRSSFTAFDRPLVRMVERADVDERWDESTWRNDATLLLRDIAGLISLQRLDPDGTVRWVEPAEAGRALVGTRPNQDPVRAALLARAAQSGEAVRSEPIELLQGGRGMLLFVPFRSEGRGFLVGVLRLDERLRIVVEASLRHSALQVVQRDSVLYSGDDFEAIDDPKAPSLRVPVGGDLAGWALVAHPAAASAASSRLANLTLAIAVAASLLVQLALLWWWAGQRRAAELRTTSEALSEANRRNAMATQVAQIGVWEWRRDSGELIWDAQCRDLFGAGADPRSPNELIDCCLDGEARIGIARALREAVSADGVLQADLAIRRVDGEPADLHLTGRVVREGRRHGLRVLGVVMDVTERQRLERMKSAFVSTVSHELRTPLTAISGALALIESGTLGALPEALRPLVRVSRENTGRLTLLINDLLDMERLAQGGLQLAARRIELGPELQRSLALNRSYADGFGVRLHADFGGEPMPVEADPDRLQQVLANLLSNACKFSSAGQEVVLAARRRNEAFRIEVRDRGAGVPEDFRPRLFSRFSQADASDSRRHSGTGLGLSICRELVERMGGTIGYEPREDCGSVFWFTLPAATESP